MLPKKKRKNLTVTIVYLPLYSTLYDIHLGLHQPLLLPSKEAIGRTAAPMCRSSHSLNCREADYPWTDTWKLQTVPYK